jgi:RNA polymerase sigma-70 factor (ECF subfamily)
MSDRRRRFEAQALPHLDAAYNLARRLTRPPLDADDIVQDAMLRAFRAFDTFRGDNMKPWLLSIVRNCHLTAVGRTGTKLEAPLPSDAELDLRDHGLIVDDPDPEALVIQTQQGRQLSAIIDQLPADFREVLVLREMEDMSYRDIAQVTGAPIGTVMSRLARARALLRQGWLGAGQEAPHAVH